MKRDEKFVKSIDHLLKDDNSSDPRNQQLELIVIEDLNDEYKKVVKMSDQSKKVILTELRKEIFEKLLGLYKNNADKVDSYLAEKLKTEDF